MKFDRCGHKAVLTDTGSRLSPAVIAVLETVSTLERALVRHGGLSGTCRFGVGELSALTWLPRFVARLCANHPDLDAQPVVDVGAVLAKRVEDGELDFAVVAGSPAGSPGNMRHAAGSLRHEADRDMAMLGVKRSDDLNCTCLLPRKCCAQSCDNMRLLKK